MIRQLAPMSVRWLAACISALLLLTKPAAPAQSSPNDLVTPSLVYLKVDFTPTKGQLSGVPQTDQSTGFLVSDDGFILTSYHLLENVSEYAGDHVKVTAALGDVQAQPVTAAIVNGLQPLDVLLLKIRTTKQLPHVTLGKASLLNIGDHIYTSGFHGEDPFNSDGTVSNKFGPLGIGYLWTVNISVAPGQSGSPVYLADGRVVGILKGQNTGASDVGYMVPIEFADALIAHLRLRDLETQIARLSSEIGAWKDGDDPLVPRLAKVESNISDVSSDFEWHGVERDGQFELDYHKLISGAPQVKSIKYKVVPLVTENDSRLTSRERPLDNQEVVITINPDGRGGNVTIPRISDLIGARLQSTPGTSISRLEVTVVPTLDDGKTLDPGPVPIDVDMRPK
jgi:S1-C subfamily serine protease